MVNAMFKVACWVQLKTYDHFEIFTYLKLTPISSQSDQLTIKDITEMRKIPHIIQASMRQHTIWLFSRYRISPRHGRVKHAFWVSNFEIFS